ncbi:MAG TPA: hypothetical protein VFA04_19880 [Bryobacteraceae bacterium]|nr:hypothetical protein [Bryobacteraceae bacterium]
MTPVRDIELAIAARKFDSALQGLAALQKSADRAMGDSGPEAQAVLRQLLVDISRLVTLARAERAHMSSDLRAVSGTALYQPSAPPSSSWRVDG